ncbi:MAG: hypothetical protein AB4060_10555, partial [Crocosphaera sp.]
YTLELLSKLVEMGKGKLEKNGRFYRFKAIFNSPPDHPPNDDNPPNSPQPPNNSNPPNSPQPPMGNRAEEVTQVTEAKTNTGEELSPSPSTEVSPVTIESDSQSSTLEPTQLTPVKTKETQDTFINQKRINSELETENDSEENIHWLLQILADLESSPAPHTRFTSNDQLIELFNEAQQKVKNCWEQLQQICPDYSQRLSTAYGVVSQLLPL